MRAEMLDPKSKYGALGRDGVSCAVCHHMAGNQLFDPATYTGLFNVGPGDRGTVWSLLPIRIPRRQERDSVQLAADAEREWCSASRSRFGKNMLRTRRAVRFMPHHLAAGVRLARAGR